MIRVKKDFPAPNEMRGISMNDKKCCDNCRWWTHDSAMMDAVIGEEGYSVCGKLHPITLYGKEVYMDIITPREFCCPEWLIDDPVPVMTDEEIRAMLDEDPETGEDDDVTDEEWSIIADDKARSS